MATLAELSELVNNGVLLNKITVAIAKHAHAILQEVVQVAARTAWANEALRDPVSKRTEMVWYLLAENTAASKAQIEAATDVQVDAAVSNAVTKRVAAKA